MNTRKTICALLFGLALAAPYESVIAQAGSRIQRSQVETMFANMRARAPWNVDGPLLWGYFFFDPSRERLKLAAEELEAAGYRVVGIAQIPGKPSFRLHVELVETHTPRSLDSRNQELYALADRLGLASYDGMDVGPVPMPIK